MCTLPTMTMLQNSNPMNTSPARRFRQLIIIPWSLLHSCVGGNPAVIAEHDASHHATERSSHSTLRGYNHPAKVSSDRCSTSPAALRSSDLRIKMLFARVLLDVARGSRHTGNQLLVMQGRCHLCKCFMTAYVPVTQQEHEVLDVVF